MSGACLDVSHYVLTHPCMGVYRFGVWRLQALLEWRLASSGNLLWCLASRLQNEKRPPQLAFRMWRLASMGGGDIKILAKMCRHFAFLVDFMRNYKKFWAEAPKLLLFSPDLVHKKSQSSPNFQRFALACE